MRILVLGGELNPAVVCVRSLAGAGHRVFVGSHHRWSKAGWSRSCAGTFTYPNPERDAEAFVAYIAIEVARESKTFVIPVSSPANFAISAYRHLILAAGGRIVMPAHTSLVRAADKLGVGCLARSLGVETPRTYLVNDAAEANQLASNVRYPAVLKARSSEVPRVDGTISRTSLSRYSSAFYARGADECLAAYRQVSQRCSAVLVQEFVQGAGAGYFALMHHGELRAEFAHLRIRDVYPSGSGSSLRVSVRPEPRLREAALAILRSLNWHGVAMVEFRVQPDGTPVFVEINPLFWGSLALAVCSGVDFPALLARMAESGDIEVQDGYSAGVRCRWLLGDFRHLIEVFRGAPAGFPGKFPGRMRTVINFVKPVPRTFHDNFIVRDPLPEIGDWCQLGLQLLGRW